MPWPRMDGGIMTKGEKKDERVRTEEKYKALVETAADAIFTLDLLGRFTFANPAAERISGYSEEELVGKHFRELLPARYIPACLNMFQKALRGQLTPPIEIEMVTKQGERVPVELLGRPVKRGKRVVEIIGIAREITERKRAEEKRARVEATLRSLNTAALAVQRALEPEDVFKAVASELRKLGFLATIFLLDKDQRNLRIAHISFSPELIKAAEKLLGLRANIRFPLDRIPQYFKEVLENRVTVFSQGSERIEGFLPAHLRGLVGKLVEILGLQKGIVAPLVVEGEVIGALAVDSPALTENDVPAVTAFANQVSIAIESARLYEETQKRVKEITALHRVSEVINATLDLKEVFQRVVEELSQTFGYRLVDIYLLEEDGLRLQANVGYDDKTTIELIPPERGVVGRVARTGKPAFIPDVSQDPDYIPAYPEIESEICMPIMTGEELLGTLNVECDGKRPLTHDDLQLLSTLSSHIGVAIENARLFEEEQRLSTQRKTIAEVGRTIAAILDLDTLLSQVVDLIAQNFRYYHVHIFQVDQDSDSALYKAGTGEAGLTIAEEGLRLKVGEEGLVGWVARHGEPVLVHDVSQDPRYYAHPDLPDTRSELNVPIRAGEKVIGVLDVQSTELNAFDESDLDTLQTLADQLAVAMENARLYEETQQLAITDGLTGLHNLRYFYEALEKEIQRSERYHRSVSLIMLDIDNFKRYNDTYGHLAGDDLLTELAQLMSKVTRQTDTLARYGGEEFVIILPETETEGAGFLAERLQEEVNEHRFSIPNGQTMGRITISLGIATYPHHADSTKALVDAADKALLRAKRAGKNRLFASGEELTELKPE